LPSARPRPAGREREVASSKAADIEAVGAGRGWRRGGLVADGGAEGAFWYKAARSPVRRAVALLANQDGLGRETFATLADRGCGRRD